MSNSKAQGVKDCIRWLVKELKEQKSLLKKEEFQRDQHSRTALTEHFFQDVHDRKIKIKTIFEIKVSLEKYASRLKNLASSESSSIIIEEKL